MAKIIITPRALPSIKEPALQPMVDAGYRLVFPSPGATPSEGQLIAALSGAYTGESVTRATAAAVANLIAALEKR